jgi:predicted amidohydrolase
LNPLGPDPLRLVVHQTAPVLGEMDRNQEEILRRVADSGAGNLLVFPELALTGYNLRGRATRLALRLGEESPLPLPPGSPPVVLGLPERGPEELIYNAALLVQDGRILAKHRKIYLPTYGLFDEGRYFAAGRAPPRATALPSGWKVGLLVCEDFWHPSLIYLLAMQGVDVILVLAAAPGRGQPAGASESPSVAGPQGQPAGASESPGASSQQGWPSGTEKGTGKVPGARDGDPWSLFSSPATWALLAKAAAIQYGVFMVIANRGGVEEGVTFAGESLVVSPDGEILARGPQAEPAVMEVALERDAIRRDRSPFAHLRDEDPHFLRRALDQVHEER